VSVLVLEVLEEKEKEVLEKEKEDLLVQIFYLSFHYGIWGHEVAG
jgi:hypothetical protein